MRLCFNKMNFRFFLALFSICLIIASVGCASPSTPLEAEVIDSVAPADGPAVDITIPQDKSLGSKPVLMINFYTGEEITGPKTFQFTNGYLAHQMGQACFQKELSHSMPVELSGTVTIQLLKHGQPVTGSYDLIGPDGSHFTGSFEAKWGKGYTGIIR